MDIQVFISQLSFCLCLNFSPIKSKKKKKTIKEWVQEKMKGEKLETDLQKNTTFSKVVLKERREIRGWLDGI